MKTYALDEIYDTERKCFLKNSEKPLNVVFIGDSLTEGDSSYEIDGDTSSSRPWHWVDMTASYLGAKTERTVNIFNAGVGGTVTGFSGKMISETVFAKNADIVFIENINDINRPAEQVAQMTENLIRNLAKAEKAPVVILVHLLNSFGKRDEEHYVRQMEKAEAKDSIAKMYGICSSVNYLEYFYNETKFDVTHKWYLTDFGDVKIANGDVHPLQKGYSRIGEYVISELEKRESEFFTRLTLFDKPVYEASDISYKMTYPYDKKFKYSGFELYTKAGENKRTGKYLPDNSVFRYPFGGYAQSVSDAGGDTLEFETESKYLSICYKNPSERFMCNTVKVYVDGEFYSNGGGSNPYANNYGNIDIKLDGVKHTVKVVSDLPEENRDVFNFLFLAEGN